MAKATKFVYRIYDKLDKSYPWGNRIWTTLSGCANTLGQIGVKKQYRNVHYEIHKSEFVAVGVIRFGDK